MTIMTQQIADFDQSIRPSSRFPNLPPQMNLKRKKNKPLNDYCGFCKNNGEPEEIWRSHILKDVNNDVYCPSLYNYKCPICHNTGKKAHTVRHCPYNEEELKKQEEINKYLKQMVEEKQRSGQSSINTTTSSNRSSPEGNMFRSSPQGAPFRASTPQGNIMGQKFGPSSGFTATVSVKNTWQSGWNNRMQDDRLSPRSSWDVKDRVCRNIFQENNAGYIPQGHSNRSRYNSSSSSQDSANSSNSRWSPTSNMWSPKWSSSQSPPSPPAENHYINRSRFVSHGQFQQQQAPGYRILEGQVSSMNGHYGHQQNNQGHQQHSQGLPNEIMLNNLMGLLKIQQDFDQSIRPSSRFPNLPPQMNLKRKKNKPLNDYCGFCKNNGEPEEIWRSHILKDVNNDVYCPSLYNYKCPICHNTGKKAHTVRHCPYNEEELKKQEEINKYLKQMVEEKQRSGQSSINTTTSSNRSSPEGNMFRSSPQGAPFRASTPQGNIMGQKFGPSSGFTATVSVKNTWQSGWNNRLQDDRLSPRSSWDVKDRVCRNIFQENNAGYIPQGHSNRSQYNSSSSSQDSANSSNSRWSPTSNMWSPKWSSSQSPPSPLAETHYINRSRFVSHGQFQQHLQAPGYRIQEGQVSSMNGHYGHQQNNQGHQQHSQGLPNEIMLNNLMGLLKIQQGELYQ